MLFATLAEELTKAFFILILISAAFIITRRDISAIISTYALQSFFISVVAFALYIAEGNSILLALCALTIVSKVLIIPRFMGAIQSRLRIKRDADFAHLTPTTAMGVSIALILLGYVLLSRLLGELSGVFIFGAVVGISLMFMGLLVIFTRRQSIIAIIGYLTMENGVLLMSLFLAELPLIIEVLITVDLISVILLATILAFGIHSDNKEVHERLFQPLSWLKREDEQ